MAEDILGGLFAVFDEGEIGYFAPDSLEWEMLDLNLSQLFYWAVNGDTEGYYQDYRWSGWKEEAEILPLDSGMGFYPFLWCEADGLESRHREPLPMEEMIRMELDVSIRKENDMELSKMMEQIGDWAEEQDVEAIIEILPQIEDSENYLQAVLWLGYAYIGIGLDTYDMEQFHKAEEWLLKVREQGEGLGVWNYRMAIAKVWQLEPQSATSYAAHAVKVEPGYPWGWLIYSKMLYWVDEAPEKQRALEAAKSGLAVVPGNEELELLIRHIEARVPVSYTFAEDFDEYIRKYMGEEGDEEKEPAMTKLYKEDEGKLLYAECWQEDSCVAIHTGTVGTTGNCEKVSCEDFTQFTVEFLSKYGVEGYHRWPKNKEVWIVAQFPIKLKRSGESFEARKKDLALRDQAESLLNESLGWAGLGHVDGWEMGHCFDNIAKDVLNIYCVVVDQTMGVKNIKTELERHLDCSKLKIAVMAAQEEGYKLVYSADQKDQTFSL